MRISIPETSVTRAIYAVVYRGFAYVAASHRHQNDSVVFIGFDWRPDRKRFFNYINI